MSEVEYRATILSKSRAGVMQPMAGVIWSPMKGKVHCLLHRD